jgi:hypothetical protein
VTIGEIFSSVAFGTPALARSATDAYGRPAMIFFAVAGPTPGSASSSLSDAELTFTVPPEDAVDLGDAAGAVFATGGAGLAGAVAPPAAVTIGVIFSIVFFGTPALARSVTDAYGRPAMIFLAVAAPTPGSASSSPSDAVFRLTGAAAPAAPCAAGRGVFAGPACSANTGKADSHTNITDHVNALRFMIVTCNRTDKPPYEE